jgi:Flp pilus assembly pilin Flp
LLKSLRIYRLASDHRAMTAWEYGLIAALMTVAILSATSTLGVTTNGAFVKLLTQVNWSK